MLLVWSPVKQNINILTFLYIMKKEENEVEINSELLNKDYDDINYNQEEFNDEGVDEGFASQIGY